MSETGNVKKGSLPGWLYKIGGIIGILLILAVVWNLFGGETKELQELKQTPMAFKFNPEKETPGQLEFSLSGTADFRGAILTNVKMSQKYPEIIETGTLKNIGVSDLEIKNLRAVGVQKQNYAFSGYFIIPGYNISNGEFVPPMLLKKGESKEIIFKLDDQKGNPRQGVKPDTVVLRGSAKETGIGQAVSVVKSLTEK